MEKLQAMYQWGIDLIRTIQTIENPPLTSVVVFITTLGAGIIYLVMLFYILWCVDDRAGMRLSILLVFSNWVNSFLKVIFKQPRPYDLDPSVGRALESTFGLPSGHAQNSLVFFMGFASWLKKPVFYVAAILITLVISFTRLYLGVHFPTDIFGGWIVGLIVLVLYWLFADRIIQVLEVASVRFRLIITAAVSFIMLLLNPTDLVMAGVFLGQGMGYTLMIRFFPFDVRKTRQGKDAGPLTLFLRYLLGIACTGVILFLGTKIIGIIGEASSFYRITTFLVFAITGAGVTAGIPWLFIQTGLAGRKDKPV